MHRSGARKLVSGNSRDYNCEGCEDFHSPILSALFFIQASLRGIVNFAYTEKNIYFFQSLIRNDWKAQGVINTSLLIGLRERMGGADSFFRLKFLTMRTPRRLIMNNYKSLFIKSYTFMLKN